MNIKNVLSEITVPSSLDDITEQAVCRAAAKKAVHARTMKYAVSFAIAAFLFLGGITVVQPVWAREIPFFNSIFEYINEYVTVPGEYGEYASNVLTASEDNGVKINLSEIYCDGENLFISYSVESKKPFSSYEKGKYNKRQLLTENISLTIKSGKLTRKLETTGYGESMVGTFADDHTFAGAAYYMDEKESFPEEFTLEITIPSLKLQSDSAEKYDRLIPGVWNFSVPVTVNCKDIKTITPKVAKRGHSIDRIVVSPLLVTIYTSYPDIYLKRDSIDYLVQCFSDKSDLPVAGSGIAGATTAFDKISRSDISGTLRIYVADAKDMEKHSADENSEEDVKKYAIVHTAITL